MRDAIEKYLEDVLCYADLSSADEHSVRAELAEHLHTLTENLRDSNPKEIYAMLRDQFGNPKKVGLSIAAAKGRVRTYFKKRLRKLPLQLAIALVLAFGVRYAVAEEFYVSGDGVAPIISRGSRVFVYKLADSFHPQIVVVYRDTAGEYLLGTIERESNSNGWLVARNAGSKREVNDVPRERIVERVFLNTR
jgi:hypothetical protein